MSAANRHSNAPYSEAPGISGTSEGTEKHSSLAENECPSAYAAAHANAAATAAERYSDAHIMPLI